MISKNDAIKIAKAQMPSKEYRVHHVKSINRWFIGLSKNGKGFEVEIDANNGNIVGGRGGA